MNFGSKFVYTYDDSEEECVSDEEFEGGMDRNGSSDEEEEGRPRSSAPYLQAAGSTESTTLVKTEDEPPSSVRPEDVLLVDGLQETTDVKATSKRDSRGWMGSISELFSSVKKSRAAHSATPLPKAVSTGGAPPKLKKKRHHWRVRSRSPPTSERAHPFLACRSEPISGRRWRRADTNVITVKFNQLKTPSNMHTGDPSHCSGCSAVLSKTSKLQAVDGSEERVWNCEFCGHSNTIDLVDDEIPQAEDVTFMLEPAVSTKASGPTGSDQSLVIFCVDISGSMCVTTEVPGKMKLRGSHLERLQSLNDTREPQYLPGQRRDVTFVSRLQAVQAAVDHQLEEIAKEYPNRRICLVTFNSEVTIIGDGSVEPLTIAGGKLSNKDELIQTASTIPMPASIKDKREQLGKKLFDLEEGGMTALGPALLLSISMASHVAGSKVIICTDGMANVGLGNLDELHSDDIYAQSASFYTNVSDMAVDGGVCVSVLSISGTKCRLVELGKVAEATGGQVNIVDPLKLTQEFGSILADPIIATNVSATLQIHSGLYLRNEQTKDSTVTKYIGNVTKTSEITFEYGVRKVRRKQPPIPPIPEPVYDNPVPKRSEAQSAQLSEEIKMAQENVANEAVEAKTEVDDSGTPDTHMDTTPGEGVSGACAAVDSEKPEEVMETAESTEGLAKPTKNAEVTTEPVAESTSNGAGTSGKAFNQDLKELPFQLQIRYTDLEGAKALRVITQSKPVTKHRAEAEKMMNMTALGVHAAQQSAQMALTGNYTHSRLNAFMYQRLLHRGRKVATDREEAEDVYDNYCAHVGGMEHGILGQQLSERRTRGGRTWSDEEDEDDEDDEEETAAGFLSAESRVPRVACLSAASVSGPAAPKSKPYSSHLGKKGVRRRMNVEDNSAAEMYANARISSSVMKSKSSKK